MPSTKQRRVAHRMVDNTACVMGTQYEKKNRPNVVSARRFGGCPPLAPSKRCVEFPKFGVGDTMSILVTSGSG